MVLMRPGHVKVQLVHVCSILSDSQILMMYLFQDIIEAVDHIPVHIGAVELKKILYNAIIPRWNDWTNNFPLHIDQINMRDKLWVIPNHDVIARNFFKSGKKGTQTFKSGKIIIHFHVPNNIYNDMIEKKDDDELAAEQKDMNITARDDGIPPSMAADFTVGNLMNREPS